MEHEKHAGRRRERYQEMYAVDAMTLEEFRSRLGASKRRARPPDVSSQP